MRTIGIALLAVFFAAAAVLVFIVGGALIFPDSQFANIWMLYPPRRALLMPYRLWLGPIFVALAPAFIAASAGCFLRRLWGWQLAIAIFAANGFGDAVQMVVGHRLEGAVGVLIAGWILFYLTRVREAFA